MSLEFRNLLLERKIFVSPVPMAAALRVGRSSSSGRSTRSAGGAGVRRRLKAAGVGGPTKTQLKRQQTLAKRRAKLQARGGAAAKPKRAKYNAATMRPRTMKEAQAWRDHHMNRARSAWAKRFVGTAMSASEVHRAERLSKIAERASGIEYQWRGAKRPPKGFRRRR